MKPKIEAIDIVPLMESDSADARIGCISSITLSLQAVGNPISNRSHSAAQFLKQGRNNEVDTDLDLTRWNGSQKPPTVCSVTEAVGLTLAFAAENRLIHFESAPMLRVVCGRLDKFQPQETRRGDDGARGDNLTGHQD